MKIALGVEYVGTDYHGWQWQANLSTVQGTLEKALSRIADEKIQTFCAGRTDAGVHAKGQVIHFETNARRPLRAWILGTNSHLPNSISVRFSEEVDDEFHARFSALSRSYRYIIYNHLSRPAVLHNQVTWRYEPLNTGAMHSAGQCLLGEKDFSSFRSSECESSTPMRNMKKLNVYRINDYVIIDIEANAFLHHMVRNIVGVLIRIGEGYEEPEWMESVLLARDRRQAAETAPASGLYLNYVTYPSRYSFPQMNEGLVLSI